MQNTVECRQTRSKFRRMHGRDGNGGHNRLQLPSSSPSALGGVGESQEGFLFRVGAAD